MFFNCFKLFLMENIGFSVVLEAFGGRKGGRVEKRHNLKARGWEAEKIKGWKSGKIRKSTGATVEKREKELLRSALEQKWLEQEQEQEFRLSCVRTSGEAPLATQRSLEEGSGGRRSSSWPRPARA